MWKRMRETWLIAFSVVDLLVSMGIAQLLVNGFGCRYTDWTGINSQPFDASNSVLAFTVIGCVLWPVIMLMAWLIGGEMLRSLKHGRSKARTQD